MEPLDRECSALIERGCEEKHYCRVEAEYHIAFKWLPDDYVENSYVCHDHIAAALQKPHEQYHEITPLCGMPSTLWCRESNRCILNPAYESELEVLGEGIKEWIC